MDNPAITARHLLTHTSEGILGAVHDYNGSRYGRLGDVIDGATGWTFATHLSERILAPLEMAHTALNPLTSSGPMNAGLDDFMRMLSLDGRYERARSVYLDLAKPYQFDEAFNPIPGMYHLYHNPAAGLLSSVGDLAKFDIALDQGALLGEAALAEMHAPAVTTYPGRPDLQYGLGWYVQDFEGLRLLWHTGRWPPSTSALYLKVPEMDLTFIVLANTDSLTTPFNGVGHGDISQSILMLTFWRYFVLPAQSGIVPPEIDWAADRDALVGQLAAVDDEAVREFLERELWSYRQAAASAGQFDMADKLYQVDEEAYYQSVFRRQKIFTQLSSKSETVSPVIPAAAFIGLSWGLAVWLVLAAGTAVWVALRLRRVEVYTRWGVVFWIGTALVLGPLAVWFERASRPLSGDPKASAWGQACGAAALAVTRYAAAWIVAFTFLLRNDTQPHPLEILGMTYFLPLLLSFGLSQMPIRQQHVRSFGNGSFRRAFMVEAISWNLGYAVFFPLTMLAAVFLLEVMPYPNNPFFWGLTAVIALTGLLVLAPLQHWLLRQGFHSSNKIPALTGAAVQQIRAWPAVLASLVVVITALALTIIQLE
jgi:CubicO group peptidase (beta-lactamase class C family)